MNITYNYCFIKGGERVVNTMNNQELCILLDSILALLETNNTEKAKEVIKNGIKRIDRGMTSSSNDPDSNNE